MKDKLAILPLCLISLTAVLSSGCYYDQLLAAQGANRSLRDELESVKRSLRTCEGRFEGAHATGGASQSTPNSTPPALDETPPPQAYEGCEFADLPGQAGRASQSLAVMDFDLRGGADLGTGRALADLCRSTVLEGGRYILLDREDILTILGEEDFASAVACDETQCLVDYGKKLAAQKMLHGRVNQVGDVLVLTLKITDVASAKVDAFEAVPVRGRIDYLTDIVRTTTCQMLREATARN